MVTQVVAQVGAPVAALGSTLGTALETVVADHVRESTKREGGRDARVYRPVHVSASKPVVEAHGYRWELVLVILKFREQGDREANGKFRICRFGTCWRVNFTRSQTALLGEVPGGALRSLTSIVWLVVGFLRFRMAPVACETVSEIERSGKREDVTRHNWPLKLRTILANERRNTPHFHHRNLRAGHQSAE